MTSQKDTTVAMKLGEPSIRQSLSAFVGVGQNDLQQDSARCESLSRTSKPSSISSPSSCIDKPSNAHPPSLQIRSPSEQERMMEEKAVRMGIRQEFFRLLNATRHEVKNEHGNCSQGIRHYLSNSIVWGKLCTL